MYLQIVEFAMKPTKLVTKFINVQKDIPYVENVESKFYVAHSVEVELMVDAEIMKIFLNNTKE